MQASQVVGSDVRPGSTEHRKYRVLQEAHKPSERSQSQGRLLVMETKSEEQNERVTEEKQRRLIK